MEFLWRLGLSSELSRDEFVLKLSGMSSPEVCDLRCVLFNYAVVKGLANMGATLVTRRKVGYGKTVKGKQVEGVWALVGSIKRCKSVPCILLKNGKHSKGELLVSQETADSCL